MRREEGGAEMERFVEPENKVKNVLGQKRENGDDIEEVSIINFRLEGAYIFFI